VTVAVPTSPAAQPTEIHVPGDVSTPQLAIAVARPGDTIVLERGIYPGGYVVPAAKHDLTIVGIDRNAVVLDGRNRRRDGFVVRAAGVSILNMSAHDFRRNAFYWVAADRFRAAYLTAWNVGSYGIYVEDSEGGTIEHDYISGAADAAYYVGECRPCDATVSHVVARLSAVGYSGTNATDVVIRDSLFDRNGAGIVPSSYSNEALAPEALTLVVSNRIVDSGRAPVPISTPLAGFVGIGVAVAGGNDNTITGNRISGSERYGVAIFSSARFVSFTPNAPEPGPRWRARRNRVTRNLVTGSGVADLALARGSGTSNCFAANSARRMLPTDLQSPGSCAGASGGDARVAADLTRRVQVMVRETLRRRQPPRYTTMPKPPAQASMQR
jgi:parallel beta-helix repeat protein